MTTPYSVLSALDTRVALENSIREPDGYWHPSGLYGCPRQAIYAIRGTEETDERDARSARILRVGHLLHGYIQGAVEQHPAIKLSYYEVSIVNPELGIKGSVDQLVQLDDATWEVNEYKTINSMAFKYKELPKPDHLGQVRAYMVTLRDFGGTAQDGTIIPPLSSSLARGRIAYVSKDDLLVEEHTVFLTPGAEEELRSKVVYLNRYREDGSALPPRLPPETKKGKTQRHYLCGYCPYKTRCYDLDPEGVDLVRTN